MIFKDYYKILGLDTNRVSIDQIKVSFREQAKKYHPDVNVGNKKFEERFKDINEAYKILSDTTSKRKYDRTWISYIGKKKILEGSQKNSSSLKTDLLTMFFGETSEEQAPDTGTSKKKKVPAKGENIETEISISIEDAFCRII